MATTGGQGARSVRRRGRATRSTRLSSRRCRPTAARTRAVNASLYSIFGSKEELIRAYLERRHALRQERTKRGLERYDNPRDKLLGVFDVLAQMISRPGYRGCAFANATAESPSASAAATVSETNRAWFRSLLTELAAAAGAGDPKLLAGQLALLYDGALTSSRMDHDRKAPARAKAAAAALLDASIP